MKAFSSYERIKRLTDEIAIAERDMEQWPSYERARFLQHLKRQRKALQEEIKPRLITGISDEDP